ncbi:hypothetical protein FPHYL_11180 [Fusarium phyllophilum]|uniref:Uncharacterized protein n=1 Tax=Fusarium phyllophilum TaxID=47803 RepID=A0A8H5IXJ0_9HYPO|nr:hypothetical protein FPHYL_11180 [Fusarium phyllophilum]
MNTSTMTSNSLSVYSQSLPAFAEQATCANPYWSISSSLLPQMSSSTCPPNERNSQRIVEDEIQALLERIDNSIYEWRSEDGTNQTIGTEEIINVPNAPAILAGENTEVDALFSGTQPTTTWSKEMDYLAFHLLGVCDSFTAISTCGQWIGTTTWKGAIAPGILLASHFKSNGTSGGSYQQTGQNGANPPTGSRTMILIKGMLIDERHLP